MTFSYTGEALTEKWEGRRYTAYQDSKGVWTNGIGHTGADVFEGQVVNDAQIERWFYSDITWAQNCVNSDVTYAINQDENNALVDLVFNIGKGNFESSTLLKDLNAGNLTGAVAEFRKWDHAGGVELAGLLARRLDEAAEFQEGMDQPA